MSSRFTNFVKETTRKAQYPVTRKTPAEKAVLEATNDEKWGPSNSQMNEIARMCNNYKEADEIRRTLWTRIGEIEHVRYVQKSLLLLEYLLRNGPESIRNDTRQMVGQLHSLTSLHRYEVGEEAALEAVIRKKAEDIIGMVNDNEIYEMERQKAAKLRSNLTSTSNVNDFGSYSQQTYSGNNYGYDDNTLPSRKTAPAPAKKESSDYEYDDAPTPTPKINQQQTNTQNNQFNPFQGQQTQQQSYQNQNQNTFDPFNMSSNQRPQQQQSYQNQNQNTFDPFNMSSNQRPQQQQSYQNQNQNTFDPFNMSSNQRQQQQPKPVDEFLDFSNTTSSQPVQTSQQTVQNQPPARNNMMDDLGGLVDFSLQGPKRDYGKARNQVRGAGPTLGSK